MPFTAIFLDADGAPYAGHGAHRVTAGDPAQAREIAEKMLSTSLRETEVRGFRILDGAGLVVFEGPTGPSSGPSAKI
ncbi:hypothetical protein [Phenylobacterium aquaticum]|uniref:hypothetical protein n=1 Tax=Phenylobacterium aquaticum TaxID=1763816 RepID=UPI001F5D96E8|nr:hypothetical protein [Phenylobacterium aquaticum]MCI3132703.1 hypothetical protein [Phenylobacterium aquaticum]